ncbi:PrsW family intramembrane metalloprotease [Brevibacterium yomogidense]|nr:PrsW family intramembrane metalloprotease [Brevibacterium yomogidense]
MTNGWSDPRRQQRPGPQQPGPHQPGQQQPGPPQPGPPSGAEQGGLPGGQPTPAQFPVQPPPVQPIHPQHGSQPRPHPQQPHPQQPRPQQLHPQQFHPQPPGYAQPAPAQQRPGPSFAPAAAPGHPGAAGPGIQPHHGAPAPASWTTQFTVRANDINPHRTRNIVLLVAGCLVVGGLGMTLFLIILFQSLLFSGVGFIIVLLSGVPLVAIIGTVLLLDRWKPQPILLMASCVLWGAVASVILTLVGQLIFGAATYALTGIDTSAPIISSVVLAPLFEETTKTVFLVVIVLAARKLFEGPLDGFMYGSLIGAGFAFTENLIYLSGAYTSAQAGGLIMLFFMRCVMSPLLHSSFSALAGLSIGFAARRGQWWMVALMWIPGLIAGMFLHGLWNGMASLPLTGLASLLVMLALSLVVALGWWGTAFFLWYRETKTARESLTRYAGAGWLTEEEAQMLGTWKGRRAGRRWATGPARPHMKAMIRVAASLPSTRDRVEAGVGGEGEKEYEMFLLNRLVAERRMMMRAMGLSA